MRKIPTAIVAQPVIKLDNARFDSGTCMSELIAGRLCQLDTHLWRVLAPNPGIMTGPGTNSYLFGRDALTMVDAGPVDEHHLEALRQAVAAIGLPLTHLLCTHSHRDHSPAADRLAKEFGIPCWGAPIVDDPFQDISWRPDRVLVDGERLEMGGMSLKVIATPGHVSNHLCYLLEDNHWLFSGDHLINGSTVVIIPPAGSMSAYVKSLERLQAEKIDVIAPGHGELIQTPQALIESTLRHRRLRENKVIKALATQPSSTAIQLVPDVYQDVGSHLHALAALSLEAHLIKLAEEHKAIKEGERWHLI